MDVVEDFSNVAGVSGDCEMVVDFSNRVLLRMEPRPLWFLCGYFL